MEKGEKTKKGATGSEATAAVLHQVLKDYDSEKSLLAVVCDNTVTNTGWKNGAVVRLEKLVGDTLHLIGCMLHWNELPLREIIKQLDGPTVSGNQWTGPFGRSLHDDIYLQTPVEFQPLHSSLQRPREEVVKDLSTDQNLLLEYVLAISSGKIPDRVKYRRPGPAVLSRWLTCATRFCVIYTRTLEPPPELVRIIKFIVQVYAPSWFNIKSHDDFLEGPKLVFNTLQQAKELGDDLCLNIVKEKIQSYAFPLLSENFLASLLYSDNAMERRLAMLRILELRANPPAADSTSKKIKTVNFEANDWSNLISISTTDNEPPITKSLTVEELQSIVDTPGAESRFKFPVHSQVQIKKYFTLGHCSGAGAGWSWGV